MEEQMGRTMRRPRRQLMAMGGVAPVAPTGHILLTLILIAWALTAFLLW